MLTSKVSVTAGPSGVGKSSLINAVNAKLGTAGVPPPYSATPESGRLVLLGCNDMPEFVQNSPRQEGGGVV